MVHLCFNIVGVVVWLTVFCIVNAMFNIPLFDSAINPFAIAVAHSGFNVLATVTLMPFGTQLAALATRLVPEGKKAKGEDTLMLDERLFVTPTIALERAHRVLLDMADMSVLSLFDSLNILDNYDAKLGEKIIADENRWTSTRTSWAPIWCS